MAASNSVNGVVPAISVGIQTGGRRAPAKSERRRMLVEFLWKLVEVEGRTRAAEMVGVNYRTLVKAEESGELTGRMNDALERMLLTAGGPAEPHQDGQGGQAERLDRLEAEMSALAKDLRDGLKEIRAAAAGQGRAPTEADGQTQAEVVKEKGAGRSKTQGRPSGGAAASAESGHVAAVRPGDRHRGACRRRLGGLWRRVAPGRGVAQAAGRASQLGEHPVLADERGAASRAGAGDAGGARADPAAREAAAQGLRAQGSDHPPLEGAGRGAGEVAKAEAAALGAPGTHRGVVAEVGPGAEVRRGSSQ